MNLQDEQEKIYGEIDRIGRGANPDVGCFHDGVAFPDEYLGARTKILWVLKNSYDETDEDGNPASDGQDIRCWFGSPHGTPMFTKMVLVSYCLERGIGRYDDSLLADRDAVLRSLRKTALVDLSKLPGASSVTDRQLKEEFVLFQDVVRRQLDLYAPDIMIFGNTLHLCHGLFEGLDYKTPLHSYIENGDCLLRSFTDAGGKHLYLEAYHPSYPGGYARYVDVILRAAADWRAAPLRFH